MRGYLYVGVKVEWITSSPNPSFAVEGESSKELKLKKMISPSPPGEGFRVR